MAWLSVDLIYSPIKWDNSNTLLWCYRDLMRKHMKKLPNMLSGILIPHAMLAEIIIIIIIIDVSENSSTTWILNSWNFRGHNLLPVLPFFYFWNLLFHIGVELINNVVMVSGTQSDSAIHVHASILPQTPLPSRLPHDTGQSSLCYTAGPCRSSIFFT